MRKFVTLLLVLLMTLGACASEKGVGTGLKGIEEGEEGDRIGTIKKSPAAKPSPTVAAQQSPPPPAPTKPAATQAAKAPTIPMEITAQGYKPFNPRVFKGTTLKVTNNDSLARSMTSDESGVFDSGMIAPGATWTYVANTVGKFNFHDETRPFIVGQLEVIAS